MEIGALHNGSQSALRDRLDAEDYNTLKSVSVLESSYRGICYFGTSFIFWFLEVCSGSARLTAAMRIAGCTTLDPVDLNTGWDLTLKSDVRRLKALIKEYRPLLTHFAPTCRIFSTAYRPKVYDANTPEYQFDMLLAYNVADLADYVVSLYLFAAIESPLRSALYRLAAYIRLAARAGFFYVDLNLCMNGYTHPASGEPIWKGLRLLTNAPWLIPLGVLCNGAHNHTRLEGKFTTLTSAYDHNFCRDYAEQHASAPKWLKLMHCRLPITSPAPGYKRVSSLALTNKWPDTPLTYTTGEFEIQRRSSVEVDEDIVMAPLRADPERADAEAMKELEDQFATCIQWLCYLKIPATKVEFQVRRSGEELYLVTFAEKILDMRDLTEKQTIQFQAYGKNHVLKWGYEKASAMAFTAYAATQLQDPNLKFGCGHLKWNGFHGDKLNEFWVYHHVSDLNRKSNFDASSETFASREAFCWNSQEISSCAEWTHCRCLGHATAESEDLGPRHIKYADDSVGLLKEQSESIFLALKQQVRNLPGAPEGLVLSCGFAWDQMHPVLPQHEQLIGWALNLYWTHSKEPMSGFDIFRCTDTFAVPGKCSAFIWRSLSLNPAVIKPQGGEYLPTERYLMQLEAGTYISAERCSGIVYSHATIEQIKDHAEILEVAGFPIPSSLRIIGLDRSLSSVGLERGRLPHMYKSGVDTAPVFYLLLHGASRLSLDGLGAHTLPVWVDEDHRLDLYNDLATIASSSDNRRTLAADELRTLAARIKLDILGIIVDPVRRESMRRFATPEAGTDLEWQNVSFRVTLAWEKHPSPPEGGLSKTLVLDKYEVGGAALAGPAHASTSLIGPNFGCTLFLGLSKDSQSVSVSRPTFDFVDISGSDVKEQIDAKTPQSGFGPRFGDTELKELSRKTGLEFVKLRQALGSIAEFRLSGGLLQRLVYSRSLGAFDWLTVVPEGPWRTVEFNGVKRRLSLRRYVILIFHCTPVGPHRDRERTIDAIQDAGLWWSTLYKEVQALLRHCLICASNKARPLVTGHQRSREYDGPFRFLIIDYVGPMQPPSARGHVYMFTCACAWSGWYWAIPCIGCDGLTAASLLFHRVICDLAGYPVCLGSDRAPEFIAGVTRALADTFGIKQVIGTAYHPQSQSPVERPHREYKMMCRTFMENVRDWDLVASIFQWTVRTTARSFNANFSPYEIITGLKPRSPLDAVLAMPSTVEQISPDVYVRELVKYLKQIHKLVDKQHTEIREQRQAAKYRELGVGTSMTAGDYGFVKKPPDKDVGKRFQQKNFDDAFMVVEVHGDGSNAKAYTLSDLAGRREGLGFSQPVAAERLTPIELLPLASESSDVNTRLVLTDAGRDRPAEIKAQSMDGRVYVTYDDEPDETYCIDLSTSSYRWL